MGSRKLDIRWKTGHMADRSDLLPFIPGWKGNLLIAPPSKVAREALIVSDSGHSCSVIYTGLEPLSAQPQPIHTNFKRVFHQKAIDVPDKFLNPTWFVRKVCGGCSPNPRASWALLPLN